jgi:hypothetical protein
MPARISGTKRVEPLFTALALLRPLQCSLHGSLLFCVMRLSPAPAGADTCAYATDELILPSDGHYRVSGKGFRVGETDNTGR